MRNKRGIEMAVTTVMMIILSIAILTILVVFLNSQTGFLSKWFKAQSTQSNVDVLVSTCDGLVTSQSAYAYCCEKKEVSFGKKGVANVKLTCDEISREDWSGGRVGTMECSVECK